MGSFQELGRCYHNLAYGFKMSQEVELAIQHYQRAADTKEKHSDQADHLSTLLPYAEYTIQHDRLKEAGEALKKLATITKRKEFKQEIVKARTDKIWAFFKEKVKEANDIPQAVSEVASYV
jgi:TPR repeat protein